jgi:tripartite-type tricarboxylate transporter receptor subunit TctC
MDTWFGVIAPPSTPEAIVRELARATRGRLATRRASGRGCSISDATWPGNRRPSLQLSSRPTATDGALHIAVETLKLKAGIDLVHVPYRGGAQAATDATSGQIELVSMGLASARVAEGGKLRVLAQTDPRRHPMFADVPTTAELGLPGPS